MLNKLKLSKQKLKYILHKLKLSITHFIRTQNLIFNKEKFSYSIDSF